MFFPIQWRNITRTELCMLSQNSALSENTTLSFIKFDEIDFNWLGEKINIKQW